MQKALCLAAVWLLACAPTAAPPPTVAIPAATGAAPPPQASSRPPELRPERQLLIIPRPRFVELHHQAPAPAPPPLLQERLPEPHRERWRRAQGAPAPERARVAASLQTAGGAAGEARPWLRLAAAWLLDENPTPAPAQRYGDPMARAPELPPAARSAYEQARQAAQPGDPVWLFASRRLLLERWRPGSEEQAAAFAEEAATRAVGEVAGDLWVLAGLALGSLQRHPEAAALFTRATDLAHRPRALALRALALYRAGQPRAALEASLAYLDEQAAQQQAQKGPRIELWGEEKDVARRVGSDALDLLPLPPSELPAASPAALSLVLGAAAQRALFRGNEPLARQRAEEALRLAPGPEAATPLAVLRACALRRGDAREAERHAAALTRLPGEAFQVRTGRAALEEEEALQMSEPPTAERLVESLARQCVEPIVWKFHGEPAGRLTLDARVYEDGQVEARAQGVGGEAARAVATCAQRLAPATLGAGPSLRATVELARLVERPRSGPRR